MDNLTLEQLLRWEPQAAPPGTPRAAALLFPAPLLPFLGRYLARQGLDFRVTEEFPQKGFQEGSLEDFHEGFRALILAPRKPAAEAFTDAGRPGPLPGFVLNYLKNLARCRLFVAAQTAGEAGPEELESGLLIEYGFQLPPGIDPAPARQGDFLAFIFAAARRPALILEPAPGFSGRPEFIRPEPVRLRSSSRLDRDRSEPLKIPLELVSEPHPAPPRALYLQETEIGWLTRLAGRLPGTLLRRLKWAGNRREGVLLLPEKEGLFLFPFGRPLRREKENLYLPARQRLRPQLEPDQLDRVLGLEPETLTFLLDDRRLEIAEKAFRPLDHHLLRPEPPAVTIKPANPESSFAADFFWDGPKTTGKETKTAATETAAGQSEIGPEKSPGIPLTVTRTGAGPEPGKSAHETEILRRKGLELRRAGDLLGAAVCFGLAGEEESAAECCRLAALALEES